MLQTRPRAHAGDVYPGSVFEELAIYLQAVQNFSLLWPVKCGYAPLRDLVRSFLSRTGKRHELVDMYMGSGLPDGAVPIAYVLGILTVEQLVGSYTYRCLLGAADYTLTNEYLESFGAAFLAYVDGHGITLR